MRDTLKRMADNSNKPAPKNYRKFENMMIIVLIPALVFVINDWGFKDELKAKRILLIVGTLLPAVIKGIGMILSNGEEYIKINNDEAADKASS